MYRRLLRMYNDVIDSDIKKDMAFSFPFSFTNESSPTYEEQEIKMINVNELRFAGLWSPFRKYNKYEQVTSEGNNCFISCIDNNEAPLSNSRAWRKIDAAPVVQSRFWQLYRSQQQQQHSPAQQPPIRNNNTTQTNNDNSFFLSSLFFPRDSRRYRRVERRNPEQHRHRHHNDNIDPMDQIMQSVVASFLHDHPIGLFGVDITIGDLNDANETSEFFNQAFRAFLNSTLNSQNTTVAHVPDPEQLQSLKRRKLNPRGEEMQSFLCCICQDEDNNSKEWIVELPCNHEFHSTCVLTHFKDKHTCPVCRYPLRTADPEYNRQYVDKAVQTYEKAKQEQRERLAKEAEEKQAKEIQQERLARCAMQVRNNQDDCYLLYDYPDADKQVRIQKCGCLFHKECLLSGTSIAKGPKLDPNLVNELQAVTCPYCSTTGQVQF